MTNFHDNRSLLFVLKHFFFIPSSWKYQKQNSYTVELIIMIRFIGLIYYWQRFNLLLCHSEVFNWDFKVILHLFGFTLLLLCDPFGKTCVIFSTNRISQTKTNHDLVHRLHAFASNSDLFIIQSMSAMIGQNDYFPKCLYLFWVLLHSLDGLHLVW